MIKFYIDEVKNLDKVFIELFKMIGPSYIKFLKGSIQLQPEDQLDHKDFIRILNRFGSKVIPVSNKMYTLMSRIVKCELVNVVDKRLLTEPEFWLGI